MKKTTLYHTGCVNEDDDKGDADNDDEDSGVDNDGDDEDSDIDNDDEKNGDVAVVDRYTTQVCYVRNPSYTTPTSYICINLYLFNSCSSIFLIYLSCKICFSFLFLILLDCLCFFLDYLNFVFSFSSFLAIERTNQNLIFSLLGFSRIMVVMMNKRYHSVRDDGTATAPRNVEKEKKKPSRMVVMVNKRYRSTATDGLAHSYPLLTPPPTPSQGKVPKHRKSAKLP